MKTRSLWMASAALLTLTATASAAGFTVVKSSDFDPHRTSLVQAEWMIGIGCPTGAKTAPFLPPDYTEVGTGTYTDAACMTGDTKDKKNQGLLLAKTGPSNNDAAAVATLGNVRGIILDELGYDIRKNGAPGSALGSHCGFGAPRFNIETLDGGFYFIGCSSPPGTATATSDGWTRLRWGGASPLLAYNAETNTLDDITGKAAKSITIVFDEGTDQGADFFGVAVLDNIDVNGVLVGRQGAGAAGAAARAADDE
jgi:hypothetical protein